MSTPKVEVRRAVYLLSAIRLLLIIVAVVVAFVLCICIFYTEATKVAQPEYCDTTGPNGK